MVWLFLDLRQTFQAETLTALRNFAPSSSAHRTYNNRAREVSLFHTSKARRNTESLPRADHAFAKLFAPRAGVHVDLHANLQLQRSSVFSRSLRYS